MAITSNSKVLFRDDGESKPPIAWPTSKKVGYMMFTGGSQIFGDMNSPTNGSIVKEGDFGAPKARLGNICYRFHIERRPDLAPQYCRSELYWGNGTDEPIGAEWYLVSMYLPKDWGFDTRPIGLGYDFKFPDAQGPANLNLKLINDELNITHQYPQGAKEKYYAIGKIVLGRWIDFAIRFKRSTGTDGLIEVYVDKVKKLTIPGANSPVKESYILWGPYKWQYQTQDGQGEGQGTYNGPINIFYDEIRIGAAGITLDEIAPPITGTVDPIPTPDPPPTGVIKIGAGSSTDKYFVGGSVYVSGANVERFGQAFAYDIPVKAGKYRVTLGFAEIYFDKAGQRVFNVKLEGVEVLKQFDVFKEAGAMNKEVKKSFDINVTDTYIDLEFVALVNNAKITSIEVTPLDTLPPVDNTIYLNDTVEKNIEITDPNGNKKTVLAVDLLWKDGTSTQYYKKS